MKVLPFALPCRSLSRRGANMATSFDGERPTRCRLGITRTFPDAACAKTDDKAFVGQNWVPPTGLTGLESAERRGRADVQSLDQDGLNHRHPGPSPVVDEPEGKKSTTERLRASLSEAVALLIPAQQQIEQLQAKLLETEEAHQKQGLEFAAAQVREAEIRADLDRALDGLAAGKRQALREEILRQEKPPARSWWRGFVRRRKQESVEPPAQECLSKLLSVRDFLEPMS